MPQMQDQSLNLLACSPVCSHCATLPLYEYRETTVKDLLSTYIAKALVNRFWVIVENHLGAFTLGMRGVVR